MIEAALQDITSQDLTTHNIIFQIITTSFLVVTALQVFGLIPSITAIPSARAVDSYPSDLGDGILEEHKETSDLIKVASIPESGSSPCMATPTATVQTSTVSLQQATIHRKAPTPSPTWGVYISERHGVNTQEVMARKSIHSRQRQILVARQFPIPKCGIFFSPYLNKLLIFEDYCPSCSGSTPHFDVWIGGGPNTGKLGSVCQCEFTLTPPSSKACAFWHFSGNTISDLDRNANKGNLWSNGKCNSGILNRYWQYSSTLSTHCRPS
ncbi:hypothetical protein BKA65DRAFT_561590 [Rhexocercosporidium sp. MPI-PUGE-AT-0058]|nr:hypothetical protein BKA65DRAFT_561590 [Rhexocercosporidium sp. MPI-PUGE-AT-0058]